MASSEIDEKCHEKTALTNSNNPSEPAYGARGGHHLKASPFGGASSFDSVEGLTPSGYEINIVQFAMLSCWFTLGIIPNISCLIVGFENDDIVCNDIDDYGFIHPRAYLKLTGFIGTFTSFVSTFYVLYLMKHTPSTMEMIINGKISEFPNKNIIFNKIMAMALILASFIWCIIGWDLVNKLNFNGCSHELITQTILGWTVVQIILMICALSSRLVKIKKVVDSEADVDDEEGSVK